MERFWVDIFAAIPVERFALCAEPAPAEPSAVSIASSSPVIPVLLVSVGLLFALLTFLPVLVEPNQSSDG